MGSPGSLSEQGALSSQHALLRAAAGGHSESRDFAPGGLCSTGNPIFLKMNLENFTDDISVPVIHTLGV